MIRRLWTRWLRRASALSPSGHRRRPEFRPHLKTLEERVLPSFVTAINTPTGTGPHGLAIGDFNNDGKLDVVTTNYNGTFSINTVSVLLGKGDGHFQNPKTLTPGKEPDAAAVGDLNGDGNLDIVVTNEQGNGTPGSGTLSVFLGNGNGTFHKAKTYDQSAGVDDVTLGDFNGDGKLDLIAANGTTHTLSALLNNGNGTFAAPINAVLTSGASTVALGDFNGDGKLDVVTTNGPGKGVAFLLLGNGDGTFSAAANLNNDLNPELAAVGDFNGDGKLDLAVGCGPGTGNPIDILMGNGNGTFKAFKPYATGSFPIALAVADVNGDGHPDLVTANGGNNANNISVLLNYGNGTFTAPLLFVADQNPVALAVGYFNNNGKPDLAGANADSNDVSVLLGENNGTFVAPRSSIVAGPGPVAMGDFNGDGFADLAVVTANPTIDVLLNNGDGTFRNGPVLTLPRPAGSVVVGDFNGDGELDIACTSTNSSGGGIVEVFPGHNNGTFASALTSTADNLNGNLAVGDFNGDGRLDLVATSSTGDLLISVMLGNGNGTFAAPLDTTDSAGPNSVAVADFNGDGKQDLAVTEETNTVSILLGNGNGTFAASTTYNVERDPNAVTAEDLNGDSHPDLVVVYFSETNAYVLLNNGNGTFAAPVSYGVGSDAVDVHVADINKDGHADIVVANDFSRNVSILTGTGTGTFNTAVYHTVSDGPEAVAVADFNRDGRLDLAVTNGYAGTVTTLLTPVATNLVINTPLVATSGQAFGITVTAVDASGNTLTGFTGTVRFKSTDTQAALPTDYTFAAGDQGVHTFTGVMLGTAGTRVLKVSEIGSVAVAGSAAVKVDAAAMFGFKLSAPANLTASVPFTLTAEAVDAFGNLISGYRGTVSFSSSNTGDASQLPANYTYTAGDSGKHGFSITLTTAGTRTLTVTDTLDGTLMGSITLSLN
jgi:hypothetical protein